MPQSPTSHPSASPAQPAPAAAENLETRLGYYRSMQLIRRFEEEAARAYAQGKIGGFLHLYIGQEAIAVGAAAALRKKDYAITTYRDHGLALARGMSPNAAMAELFGKVTGCSKGLGGSMHFFDVEHRMLGGYGIVGGHIPLAVGAAFASKYREDGNVAIVFFGDGAVSIGDFHESMSLASLWKLPVVFVCENNEYSMGTSLARTLSVEDVSQKAVGYNMRRDRFFATSATEVKARLGAALEHARATSEPSLVEVRTYRYRGHSMSDPGKYRTPKELEERKAKDALTKLRAELEAEGKQAELDELDAAVEAEVQGALKFADESAEPGPELLEATTYKGEFAR